MADVLIHRCALRVVRRGGWSWGPDPKRFLDEVVRVFPALLARKLDELFHGEEDRELAAPIRIRIPLQITEFAPDALAQPGFRFASEAPATPSLEDRVELALRAAFGRTREPPPEVPRLGRLRKPESQSAGTVRRVALPRGAAIERQLSSWREEGALEGCLAAFSLAELEIWHGTLWRHGEKARESEPGQASAIVAQMNSLIQARASQPPMDIAEVLRFRLILVTEMANQHRLRLNNVLLWEALDRVLPCNAPQPRLDATGVDGEGSPLRDTNFSAATIASAASPETVVDVPPRFEAVEDSFFPEWETHVACSLPFLLLGPLAQIGYLDMVAAVLEAARLSNEATLFAAALAYKVLDPPERGWRRSPKSQIAAAAFSGLRSSLLKDDIEDFSRRISRHLGPLDRFVADAVIAGHAPGEPVLLCRAESERSSGFMLLDFPGCFPIACMEELPSLSPILERLGHPVLLVSREASGPRVFRALDTAGSVFVSGVPPTRHEPWRRIQQGPVQLGWTNHPEPSCEPVLRAARDIAEASEEAAALWEALAVKRPAVVRPAQPALDQSLTLAAAVSMGVLSWKLWKGRARTAPQLALERFGDLDARVRADSVSVKVRLPLGRRHQELFETGLLAPIADVPWLDGRRVEFGGG